MNVLLVFLLYPLYVQSSYVPGTPGAPWTDEEVLAVKAKLRQGFQKSPSQLIREQGVAKHACIQLFSVPETPGLSHLYK